MENAVRKPIYPNDLEKRQEQAHTHAYQEHDDSCGCGHEQDVYKRQPFSSYKRL